MRAEGLPELKVVGVEQPIALRAAETRPIAVRLQAALVREMERETDGTKGHDTLDALSPGTHTIEFIVQAVDDDKVVRHEKSSFIIPR